MVEDLRNRVALVTGGAKRLGREISLLLAERGARVVVHYNHSKEEAEELAREIAEDGGQCDLVQADFGQPEGYQRLIEHARDACGRDIDILVNNASVFPEHTLKDVTFADVVADMQVNAWAPFAVARAFAAQSPEGGHILNLLDTRIAGYDFRHVAYILSKHVLGVLTRMLAVELAPRIQVNAVAPGLVLPPPGEDVSYLEKLAPLIPLKRHGCARDIAQAAVFLITSSFITGQVVYVDGGRHLKDNAYGPHSH